MTLFLSANLPYADGRTIAVQYWTIVRIIIHVGLSDARTRISLRRFDTRMLTTALLESGAEESDGELH